ncbi:MAG TPA: sugar ABC transporter permease [Anaerolineae bacterium]|nr:sugar ABC transporter permease [Anaerolineae bacterium]
MTTIAKPMVLPKRSLLSRWRRHRIAYAFIAPAVFIMLIIHIIPSLQAIYMSFLDLRTQNLLEYLGAPFVGLQHYQNIIASLFGSGTPLITNLGQSLENTFWYTAWVQTATLVFGTVLALLLNREFRGRGIARTLTMLPWVVPTFVTGIIWNFIFLQQGGLANRILVNWLHVADQPITWLINENARAAFIIATVWRGLPYATVTLLSGMQVIPADLYEAASIDGASSWQRFRYITLPLLKPLMVVITMFGVIFNFFGFGAYNIGVTLFGTDNLGRYVNLITINIVRQTFNNQLYGYGAAASVLLMLLAFVYVGLWYRVFRSSLRTEE